MNLIIVGAGEVGTYLARILAEEGHQITVIDSSESACEEANKLDVFVVNGSGSSTRALEAADAPLRVHYVANVDGYDLASLLRWLDPDRALFLVP